MMMYKNHLRQPIHAALLSQSYVQKKFLNSQPSSPFKKNPEQHTPDKWTQVGDGKGGKRKIPTEKPEKVKW